MKISAIGLAYLRAVEGRSLETYICPAGKPTIGHGHTGSEAYLGNKITAKQAIDLLLADLIPVEGAITDCVTFKLNQNQFDALAGLIFNIGVEAFKDSTLLKKLNDGNIIEAASEFSRWVFVTADGVKKKSKGLIIRRCKEALLFLRD